MPSCAGVVQLLNSGHLPHDYWDWDFSAGFSWGPDAEEEEAQPAKAQLGTLPATAVCCLLFLASCLCVRLRHRIISTSSLP